MHDNYDKLVGILLKSWILTAMASASLIRRESGIYLYNEINALLAIGNSGIENDLYF